ncbi:serine/threonine protein kinase [bacterium]|nr:serine/threonine protein kinase [bacterium]
MHSEINRKVWGLAIQRGIVGLEDLMNILGEDQLESLLAEVCESTEDDCVEPDVAVQAATQEVESKPVHGVWFGRYEQPVFLGEGATGRVFTAFDPVLRRYVAVKLLKTEDMELRERLIREARAQARVQHPNVCAIYEAGEIQGQAYIVMQYINGGTLKQIQKKLSLREKTQIMRDVANGLHAAHLAGIVHRDVKPSNIMVERTETDELIARIIDFGFARVLDALELTRPGTIIGSPLYMSPEQARGETEKIDSRTDTYALGVTLYELLVGTPPYERHDICTVLKRTNVPAKLEMIVLKCLEKEQERRYDSARALSDDLNRFLLEEPVNARYASALVEQRS